MIAPNPSAVVERIDAIAVIAVDGEVSGNAELILQHAYEESVQPSTKELLLDLSGVDYINSTGISILIRLISQARKDAVRISFSGLTEHYTEIFHITRMTDYVRLFPNRQIAVQELINQLGIEGDQNDQT